jgi:BirA family biotin operon repressor/biotin-[acetyl-CoA-carboxylase] ligase
LKEFKVISDKPKDRIRLDTEQVRKMLNTKRLGKSIVHLPSTASTNTEAKALLEDGCGEGTVVISDIQTEGRGRLKRSWLSPKGGLWTSIVLKPKDLEPEKLPIISLMAGVAVAEILREQYMVNANLKWPNDILLKNKKLGGILSESIYSGKELAGVVIGIGLNLDFGISELDDELQETAITLKDVLQDDKEIHLESILASILTILETNYDMLLSKNVGPILNRWCALSTTLGSKVSISLESEDDITGTAESVNGSGALIIVKEDGSKHAVIAGDCIHLDELAK